MYPLYEVVGDYVGYYYLFFYDQNGLRQNVQGPIWIIINSGVQSQTNSIEKPQIKPIQIQTAKNHIWFGYIRIIFYSTAWFGSVCGFDFTNRTKPNQTAI